MVSECVCCLYQIVLLFPSSMLTEKKAATSNRTSMKKSCKVRTRKMRVWEFISSFFFDCACHTHTLGLTHPFLYSVTAMKIGFQFTFRLLFAFCRVVTIFKRTKAFKLLSTLLSLAIQRWKHSLNALYMYTLENSAMIGSGSSFSYVIS